MAPIRILLVDLAQMLEQVVREIVAAEPDLEIAGGPRAGESVARAAERLSADVVISGAQPSPPAAVVQLIERPSRMRVLALSRDGVSSQVWSLIPEQTNLGELSPRLLVSTIRAAAATGPKLVNESN